MNNWYHVELEDLYPDYRYYLMEYVVWCEENCTGQWCQENNRYSFELGTDATAFALRWA